MNLEGVLEGLLFVEGDEGVTLEEICSILEISTEEAKELLLKLKKSYEAENRGMRIRYLGDTFKLTTKEEHRAYYQKLLTTEESNTLSPAALEVLAIIAYNEPITRIEIDEIRGLSSDYTLRKLLAKGLIKEAGKSTMPGHPNLYKTTHEFLDYFGLATKNDLPKLSFLEPEEKEEQELFTSIYKEDEKTLEKV
mgnify:CR=1 FL=1